MFSHRLFVIGLVLLLFCGDSFAFPSWFRLSSHTSLYFSSSSLARHRRHSIVVLSAKKKRVLSPLRVGQELDGIPFEEYVEDLEKFIQEFGHARVPMQYASNPRLANWVRHLQTEEYPVYREFRSATAKLRKINKNYNVTTNVKNATIYTISSNYTFYDNVTQGMYLTQERVKRLVKLGLVFKRRIPFEERIETLLAFQTLHGHLDVPRRYPDNPSLANWVSATRQHYRKWKNKKPSRIEEYQIKELESIGFQWEIKMGLKKELAVWEQRINELQDFRREHGHCRVPPSYRKNPGLAQWVFFLRQNYRLRKDLPVPQPHHVLTDDIIRELEEYGFVWETGVHRWAGRLEELYVFREEHGHIRVPKLYSKNPQLGRWLSNQRTQYRQYKLGKKSKLNETQVASLEDAGFEWNEEMGHGPRVDSWLQKLQEVRNYQTKHNCTGIPKLCPGNRPLALWYHSQLCSYRQYKQGKTDVLTEQQVMELEEVGVHKYKDFRERTWDSRMEDLQQFREKHGHCRVPQKYAENQVLANWVGTMRQAYWNRQDGKPSRMTDEMLQQLEDADFDFVRRRQRPGLNKRE